MYSAFAWKLAKARRAKGLTQGELAAKLGRSRAAIANWEVGNSLPELPMFVDLCKALKVKPNDILGF